MELKIDYFARHPHLAPQIARWLQDAFGYLTPAVTPELRAQKLREAMQVDMLPMALVALSAQDVPVGVASILPSTLTHKHLTPWLSTVFVLPEHRGQGIGSALSQRALHEAARLGLETLYLFTPDKEKLYARLGWKTFEYASLPSTPITLMARTTSDRSAD